ncbi:thiolase family protein [Staphylococcus sp. NRL 16/872]|uniref:thiolase family protein n=1 Tax=Staphylococcus sp. NRL 16/872 TaxID=2930131 RepID=UPI001FB30EAA|nr:MULTISPECIES: thiolase family protein [unclassified Staphylococcus]MCJ1657061.1 thiolase family protein [Staphylococcus sp. NRL 21/187]MCJ1668922.1 thiolase family protein [Staphylococcus sp. NRL 19/737]WEN69139.1 thiolase family protein [Staphylococcus sp. NRL 16/872]
MKEAVIVWAKRTPFGKYGGTLKHLEPEQLLLPLFQKIKNEFPEIVEQIDDVILGNVVGNGGNIARKALLEANLSIEIPGVTVDRQCGSGLESIIYACRMVQCGAGRVYVAGGVESTSRAPWKIKRPQSVYETQLPQFYERASFAPEGQDPSMIEAAENVAKHYRVSRVDQDAFAVRSHRLTAKHFDNGDIQREIVPLRVKGQWFERDESIKSTLTEARLNRLRPLLDNGTVTAGNSCMKNDGAGLVLVMEKELAIGYGFMQGLKIKDAVTTGVDPTLLGIGPVPAVKRLLEQQTLQIEDIDVVELNEAFSSQVLASINELHLDTTRVNQWGGAIASGHPYGASGAALVARLFNLPAWRLGIATMGIGGGMGNAILFEKWHQ